MKLVGTWDRAALCPRVSSIFGGDEPRWTQQKRPGHWVHRRKLQGRLIIINVWEPSGARAGTMAGTAMVQGNPSIVAEFMQAWKDGKPRPALMPERPRACSSGGGGSGGGLAGEPMCLPVDPAELDQAGEILELSDATALRLVQGEWSQIHPDSSSLMPGGPSG